jgi:hypothetical protein
MPGTQQRRPNHGYSPKNGMAYRVLGSGHFKLNKHCPWEHDIGGCPLPLRTPDNPLGLRKCQVERCCYYCIYGIFNVSPQATFQDSRAREITRLRETVKEQAEKISILKAQLSAQTHSPETLLLPASNDGLTNRPVCQDQLVPVQYSLSHQMRMCSGGPQDG